VKGCLYGIVGIVVLLIVVAAMGGGSGSSRTQEPRDPRYACLSGWDGSHFEFKDYVRERMRNPRSFEHVETRITAPAGGRQTVLMSFRAENGFGGMNNGVASAEIMHPSCTLIRSTVEIAS
jgi:hypothetical protein